MADWIEERPGTWRKDLWLAGKRTKLTFKGTKREAQEYEARRRIELGQTGIVSQKNVPAFETFCVETYKPHAQASLRASTWNVRRYQLSPLIEHFKLRKLTTLTTATVEGYKQERIKSVGKVTVNAELNVLSAVLSYARHLALPCATPKMKRFAESKSNKAKIKAYSREEVGFILAGATEVGPDFFTLVKFLVETGCRKSEAINLPWSRVDLPNAMVRIWSGDVDDEDDGEEYEVKSVEREVTLSDGLVRALKEQKLRVGASPWVFPVRTNRASSNDEKRHTKGERYAAWPKHTWARVLKLANARAKEAKATAKAIVGGPHRLRHTFASTFLAVKPDLFALGRILGHSNSRVTELYAHLLPDHLATTRNVVTFEVG